MTLFPPDDRPPYDPNFGAPATFNPYADDPYGYRAEAARFEQQRRQRRRSTILASIVGVVTLTLLIVISPWDPQRRIALADQWVVWTQPPSSEIDQLAQSTEMTETARRIFFATTPEVDDASNFNQHCRVEGQIVLGCYEDGEIYLYRVSDERLAGTTEVTAAHEMLHAAYQRMSESEKRRIDGLVSAYVATLPASDPTLKLMSTYPDDQHLDEWHSRLGTEYSELGGELEKHYAEYFTNRGAVLALATGSTAQLNEAEQSINQLVAQLDALEDELSTKSDAFESERSTLNHDIDEFNGRADRGEFSSQQEFDTARNDLQRRSGALATHLTALNADIARYNELAAELQERDSAYAELYSHLDSHS